MGGGANADSRVFAEPAVRANAEGIRDVASGGNVELGVGGATKQNKNHRRILVTNRHTLLPYERVHGPLGQNDRRGKGGSGEGAGKGGRCGSKVSYSTSSY